MTGGDGYTAGVPELAVLARIGIALANNTFHPVVMNQEMQAATVNGAAVCTLEPAPI
jgi:hypothetical protein